MLEQRHAVEMGFTNGHQRTIVITSPPGRHHRPLGSAVRSSQAASASAHAAPTGTTPTTSVESTPPSSLNGASYLEIHMRELATEAQQATHHCALHGDDLVTVAQDISKLLPRSAVANPAALGLAAFALTTFVLSAFNRWPPRQKGGRRRTAAGSVVLRRWPSACWNMGVSRQQSFRSNCVHVVRHVLAIFRHAEVVCSAQFNPT